MYFRALLAISVLNLAMGISSAEAVVANSKDYLSVKTAPPAICYIEMWNDDASSDALAAPSQACTGTLIRPNRVLTAGHCVPGLKKAARSQVSCNNGSQTFGIRDFATPPQYNLNNPSNISPDDDLHDVAIIDLEDPEKEGSKKYITPMTIAGSDDEITAALANSSQCQLWGYGRSDDSTTDNTWGTLRGANIDYMDASDIFNADMSAAQEREIYIGFSVHAGEGDSGGPIVCPSANGDMIEIATSMSMGTLRIGNDKGQSYSVHEKISYNLDWINQEADLPSLNGKK